MSRRFAFVDQLLQERTELDRLRATTAGSPRSDLVNVCSNDYLGLRSRPALTEGAESALRRYGAGSGASRLLGGTTPLHHQLEEAACAFMGREASLLFNSGFQLNSSLIPALANRDTRLYMDRLNHNSLVQGAIASRAVLKRYDHADLDHLESLLKAEEDQSFRRIIISEAVFSMDGDIAPIDGLIELADRFDAILVIDEAHSLGVMGPQGRGLCFGKDRVDIVIGTFGKAFGTFGAVAAASSKMRSYLVNTCGGFIYTTSLPPAVVGATLGAFTIMPYLKAERSLVFDHAQVLREAIRARGFDVRGSQSPIVPAVIGTDAAALAAAKRLEEAGFLAHAVRPPTVEEGSARLRFTTSALHTREQIAALAALIAGL